MTETSSDTTPRRGGSNESRPTPSFGQAHAWARIGVISYAALVVAQLVYVLAVVPRVVEGYAVEEVAAAGASAAVATLSERHLLAPLLLAFDLVLFGVMYLLSRRFGWGFLLVPSIVLLVTGPTFMMVIYLPVFEAMNRSMGS